MPPTDVLCGPKCFMSSVGLVSLSVKCSGRLRSEVRVRVRVTESICSPEQTLSHVSREMHKMLGQHGLQQQKSVHTPFNRKTDHL